MPKLLMIPVVPIAAGIAAWAVAEYTRTSLGAWRFLIVAPLALYAVGMGFGITVFGLLMWMDASDRPVRRKWIRRAEQTITPLIVCALVYVVAMFAFQLSHDGLRTALDRFPWLSLLLSALVYRQWRRDRLLERSADVPAAQADQAGGGQHDADGGHHE
ncbi:hypothetical protein [Actinospica robiniae]|uniref:hypothetical protein n=1 Tax=Actinospica robiniae TaxID=304901 RepID=UPI00146FA6B9|nr:hypothetical protein [Actinospica robiniae]